MILQVFWSRKQPLICGTVSSRLMVIGHWQRTHHFHSHIFSYLRWNTYSIMPFQKSYWSVSIFGAGLAVHRLAVCTPSVPAHHHATNISNSCTQKQRCIGNHGKKTPDGKRTNIHKHPFCFPNLERNIQSRRHKQPIKHTLFSTKTQYPI